MLASRKRATAGVNVQSFDHRERIFRAGRRRFAVWVREAAVDDAGALILRIPAPIERDLTRFRVTRRDHQPNRPTIQVCASALNLL